MNIINCSRYPRLLAKKASKAPVLTYLYIARALNLYRKLPTQDQQLIKVVTNTQKEGNPTTQAIILEYQKISQTPTSETWITQKLNEAENAGTIKKVLINKDDNPTFAWKNQIPQKPPSLNDQKTDQQAN